MTKRTLTTEEPVRRAVPSNPEPLAPPPGTERELASAEELRALLGTPHPAVLDKVHHQLDDRDLAILANSPFCVLSTADARGNCDASPRGGVPGFVHVVDRGTVALPDRPGNRRGDSLHNVLDNSRVGLLHLVPGSSEILRINGRARILTDAPFFDALTERGQRPTLALVVDTDEIYRHCPQSLTRAGVWQPASWPTT